MDPTILALNSPCRRPFAIVDDAETTLLFIGKQSNFVRAGFSHQFEQRGAYTHLLNVPDDCGGNDLCSVRIDRVTSRTRIETMDPIRRSTIIESEYAAQKC